LVSAEFDDEFDDETEEDDRIFLRDVGIDMASFVNNPIIKSENNLRTMVVISNYYP